MCYTMTVIQLGGMVMFIGRERELKTLEQLYTSNKFEFVVLYGRRRVGKTALLTNFIENKRAIYFMGVESNAQQNLDNFSRIILEYASGISGETSFSSFQAALEYVFKLAEKERIALVIDEYPVPLILNNEGWLRYQSERFLHTSLFRGISIQK